MNQDEITNATQVLCTLIGGILVSHGWVTGNEWTGVTGGIMALVGPITSIFVSHWNKIKVSETAKVIGGALIAFLLLMPAAGWAADLSRAKPLTKAPADVFNGYPAGSGFYFGVNTALATGQANGVSATTAAANAGALTTQQGEVGLTIGYTWGVADKPIWYAVEGTFDFSNINAKNPGPLNGGTFSLQGPADFEQIVILGAPWGVVTSFLPNLNWQFPPLPTPNGVTLGNPNLYVFLGAYEQDVSGNFGNAPFRDWLVGITTGLGARALASNSTAVDVRFEYRAPTQSQCLTSFQVISGCAGLGSSYMARTAILF